MSIPASLGARETDRITLRGTGDRSASSSSNDLLTCLLICCLFSNGPYEHVAPWRGQKRREASGCSCAGPVQGGAEGGAGE
jgi:hypothetical protein